MRDAHGHSSNMEGEWKKRKVDGEDEEEDKVEKFYALIRSTKDLRDCLSVVNGCTKEENKEEEVDKQLPVWTPRFEYEDFKVIDDNNVRTSPSPPTQAPTTRGGKAKEEHAEDSSSNLSLKLSL
ncbi:hypothetical protein FRX31_035022 [Thalictrum thalictroides]|uniref:NIM1-interacting protein n=1 Tax=Thalictrum thalictroides TaxID=46969 RepID=A0A7J6UT21_THATH|nr:hypothetical protein FRX31_035022 [Thalictrum thalictroides]